MPVLTVLPPATSVLPGLPGSSPAPAAPTALRRPGPAARHRPTLRPATPWSTLDTVALFCRLARGPRAGTGLTLWLVLLSEAGAPTGLVIPVPDLPPAPDPWVVTGVLHAVAAQEPTSGREARVAVGYAQAAGGGRTVVEVAWSRALRRAATEHRVNIVTEVAVGPRRASVLSAEHPASRAA